MPETHRRSRWEVSSALAVCLAALLAGLAPSCRATGENGLSSADPPDAPRLPEGTWGGDHVAMEVSSDGVILEFDCAHGTIPQAPVLDEAGNLEDDGEYVLEHGGPQKEGEPPDAHPALFSGNTDGQKLTLTIFLTDTKETLGPFTLTRGGQPRLMKCL